MTADQKDILYSGNSSYKYVDKLIKDDGRELMIISPYLSGYYVKILTKAALKKKIRIITSGNSLGYKGSDLKKFEIGNIWGYIKAIAFFAILCGFSIFFRFLYTTIILTLIIVGIIAIMYLRYKKTNSNMQVKVITDRFVHEKLYIGDNMAISGSANLTYNGMHRNIEHIEVIKDSGKVNELKSHFESMWKNA